MEIWQTHAEIELIQQQNGNRCVRIFLILCHEQSVNFKYYHKFKY